MYSSFQAYLEQVKPALDKTYDQCLKSLLHDVPLRDRSSLRAAISTGKKIRGGLLCLIHDSMGGGDSSALIRAAAVELIHAASLVHDDFVDQDTIRRSRPATWTLEGARKAVLLGDLIFSSAIQMMNQMDRESGLLISYAIAQVVRGACQEQFEPAKLIRLIKCGRMDGTTYQKIISLKTGTLFAVACRLGAIAAGAEDELKEKAYQYGMIVGEGYQLADDLKEIRNHLVACAIDSQQMMLLAPLFSYFVQDSQLLLIPFLQDGFHTFNPLLQELFQKAEQRLVEGIEDRLNAAAIKFAGSGCSPNYENLLQSAPRNLIDMFDRSG